MILAILISGMAYGQDPGYYNGTGGKNGEDLKSALHTIIDQHVDFSYSDAKYILNYADSDPANEDNLILFYTKRSQSNDSWGSSSNDVNREHVWAKSHGDFEDVRPMDGDAFNLHPADASVNMTKSNLDFDECSDEGTLISEANAYYTSSQFEPSDAAKGEVARTIFYMAVRYEGTDGELDLEVVDALNTSPQPEHGKLSALLQWNRDFPPTDLERRRNERVFQAQRNRNPFIDHPEFADLIWGGQSVPGIVIDGIMLAEEHPRANSTTGLSATITGNTEATLYHGTAWDAETQSASMSGSGDTWTGSFNLTGYAPGDLVYYKIEATDGSETVVQRGTYRIPAALSLTALSAVQGNGSSTPMNNATVSIGGIVTANFDNTMYIQNGSDVREAMCIYDIRRGKVGDSVIVTGVVTEYNTLTEITDVSYIHVFPEKTLVEPVEISIDQANEDYEGMLVRFNNVNFLEGDTPIPVNQQMELHFTDGSSTMTVYSRYNSRLGGNMVPSGTVSVTGILSQYQGNFQLLIPSIDYIQSGDDSDAPMITGVVVNDASWIEVSFNEKLDKASAEVISNYAISDGVTIQGAYLYNDTKVLLLVSGIREMDYTLTVTNVEDLRGNAITEATTQFSSDYSSVEIQYEGIEDFSVYPNPAKDVLNIEFSSGTASGWLQVFDMNGKRVAAYDVSGYTSVLTLDTGSFSEGTYFLHLNSGSAAFTKLFHVIR